LFALDEGFHNLPPARMSTRCHGRLTTTKATLTERPDLVSKTIRATTRAVRLIRNDKKYVIDFIKAIFRMGKDKGTCERISMRPYNYIYNPHRR